MVTAVPAWMLDPAACAGMEIGSARVALSALLDLHHLLVALGFRIDSRSDSKLAREHGDEATETGNTFGNPRVRDGIRAVAVAGISPGERNAAIVLLANLLMEAADAGPGENDNERL